MERHERETVITINVADLDAGYFLFGTTEKCLFNRLCKRVGKSNLMNIEESQRWFECRVPKEFLNLKTFAIGKKRKRVVSAAQKERLISYLKASL